MKGKNRETLIKELTRDEGYRQFVYDDSVGIATIGIGRNLEHRGLTKEEAQFLLNNDIEIALAEANKLSFFKDLSPVRQRVILNMIFNIGLPRLKQFKNTIKYIKAGDYDNAAIEMLESRWARQVGVRAKRLSKLMRAG